MGFDKEERCETRTKEQTKIGKPYIACLWSFLVSLAGALLLAYWEYEYHPTNSQLWMVPFGLILFVTPLIIWFALFVSDIFCFPDDHVHDPEKMIKPTSS